MVNSQLDRDRTFMRRAYEQALKSYEEGGLPIGAVMVVNGAIVAEGHNRRVQDGDPTAHGEMDCFRRAGRRNRYEDVTLYTTLSPCMMCSGTILQFGAPRVVVGEAANFPGNPEFLRGHGVDVLVLDDPACTHLMRRFIRERPELWDEDIAGRVHMQESLPSTRTSMPRNTSTDAAVIRQLMDGFAAAFRARDIDGVMSLYAPGIVSFDLVAPLQYVGAERYRKPWEDTFRAYDGPIEYEIRDPQITVGGDVAFSHSLNRMRGTTQDGQQTDLWLRWTACFRRIDGRWLVTHEHVSVPIDVANGRACLDLEP